MRIISGKLKRKSIKFVKNSQTRPLKDIVRENIFNILKHSNLFNIKIENSNILDLYSGIGSFGIECISRGAHKVTFIEKDKNSSNILKENLNKLSVQDKALVISDQIENFLKKEKKRKEKFDLFFLDPPFTENKFLQILNTIKKLEIYKSNHLIILHRERKTNDNFDTLINVIDYKIYGRSKIIFGLFSE
tara:strand:+ start:526 stop:1095 length:570 start_codon:yes stop_codon:yes gene_type:complete